MGNEFGSPNCLLLSQRKNSDRRTARFWVSGRIRLVEMLAFESAGEFGSPNCLLLSQRRNSACRNACFCAGERKNFRSLLFLRFEEQSRAFFVHPHGLESCSVEKCRERFRTVHFHVAAFCKGKPNRVRQKSECRAEVRLGDIHRAAFLQNALAFVREFLRSLKMVERAAHCYDVNAPVVPSKRKARLRLKMHVRAAHFCGANHFLRHVDSVRLNLRSL